MGTVRRSHLAVLQNIPGQQLSIRQCKGERAIAVFALHDDGIYQKNMRATAATRPAEVQMRNQHRTEYELRSLGRKFRQVV